jgi:hypothetical protein
MRTVAAIVITVGLTLALAWLPIPVYFHVDNLGGALLGFVPKSRGRKRRDLVNEEHAQAEAAQSECGG